MKAGFYSSHAFLCIGGVSPAGPEPHACLETKKN